MLAQNIPLQMKPKEQWEVCENAWEAVVERAIYEEAQKIAKERWKDTLDNWAANPKEKQGADGPLREGFSVDIAENALEEAGAETIRNTNIWFINVLPFPLQIIRNVSGR